MTPEENTSPQPADSVTEQEIVRMDEGVESALDDYRRSILPYRVVQWSAVCLGVISLLLHFLWR